MDKKSSLLMNLGLTPTEAHVYVALVSLGTTTTGPLVKKTKLHRATVYDVLKRLMERGLVSYITKQKTKHFQATDPQRFLDFLAEEEQHIAQKKAATKELITELMQLSRLAPQSEAQVLISKRAIKSVYEMVLRHKENWVIGSHGRFSIVLGTDYLHRYQSKKKQLGIKTRLVLSERMRGTDVGDKQYADIRFLPHQFDSPTTTILFGPYVAMIIWTDTPMAFLIQSKDATLSFRNYFDVLWHAGKR